ncbi:dTDP-4-dehydrorhamnose 3,5-epimerase [anaerobic digester metagenome]
METINTEIPGVEILLPVIHHDDRGWFYESYNKRAFSSVGLDMEFIQDNHSLSIPRHTLRGIHFQNDPTAQSKLVRCIRGRILDYAVDLRKGSETYLKWVAVELSAENKRQLFIPRGFGHVFLTLEEDCEVNYKVDNIYSKSDERTIRYDDPEIAIRWPENMVPVLSEKDKNASLLVDCDCNFKI